MNKCPKCGKELEDGAKFCDECGASVFEVIFCPNCGEKTSSEYRFCEVCGASVVEEDTPEVVSETEAVAEKTPKKPIPKKLFLFGGIAIAAIAVIVLIVSLIAGGSAADNYGLYLKDGEMIFTDFSEEGSREITSRLLEDVDLSDYEGYEMSWLAYGLSDFVAFSEDNSKIFYADRLDDDADGVTLYYRDLKNPEEDPVKIDSDIECYSINAKGDRVVYLKGEDGNLYIHNLEDKEKIANEVYKYYIAEDLSKIGYWSHSGGFYLWYADKDSVKLASDVESVEYVSDDLTTVYYLKDDALYKQVEGAEDKEKIASDVYSVEQIYASGEIYYAKVEDTQISLMDYVNDDMAESDANITEPSYPDYPDSPDYPSWWDYDTDAAYNAAVSQYESAYEAYEEECDRLTAEYEQAYEAYWAKVSRDSLRESLMDAEMENEDYSLYYYNGTENVLLTDALANIWSTQYADDAPVAVVSIFNQSEVQKVKLSEINYVDEVSDLVSAALYSASEEYLAIGSNLSVIDNTDADEFELRDDGSALYFLDDVSDSGNGDLYVISIVDGTAGTPEMYDSDVNRYGISILENGMLSYYKNYDSDTSSGDLYVDGEEIDYEVEPYNVWCVEDTLLYVTDWNDEKEYGTLKTYKDGTKTKIADDVNSIAITPENDILYLYDYSLNYMTGTLYIYENGNVRKLDEDVAALIRINDSVYKGGY